MAQGTYGTYVVLEADDDGDVRDRHRIEAEGPLDAIEIFYARYPMYEQPAVAGVLLDSIYGRCEAVLS